MCHLFFFLTQRVTHTRQSHQQHRHSIQQRLSLIPCIQDLQKNSAKEGVMVYTHQGIVVRFTINVLLVQITYRRVLLVLCIIQFVDAAIGRMIHPDVMRSIKLVPKWNNQIIIYEYDFKDRDNKGLTKLELLNAVIYFVKKCNKWPNLCL